jgi:hypothetical protein
MSVSDLKEEARGRVVEPLLPIEKKLIGWSFGLGVVLLAILVTVNHLVPVKF